jgi:hypothetical protein
VATDSDGALTFGEWDGGESLGRSVQLEASEWLLDSDDATIDSSTAYGRNNNNNNNNNNNDNNNNNNNDINDNSNAVDSAIEPKRGQGICTFENGDSYVGQWVAEKRTDSVPADGGGTGGGGEAPKPKPSGNRGVCVWEHAPGPVWTTGASVSFYGGGFYKCVGCLIVVTAHIVCVRHIRLLV